MNPTDHKEQYALYKAKQSQLTTLIQATSNVTSKLNTAKVRNALDKLCEKVHNTSFKIQIAGTFKNGKSTFINALLGEEILPAYALPCTAVINEVKYGEEKKATLHFKNPLPDTLPSQIAEKASLHIKKHGSENVPPMDIPYDEIEDYVIIPIGKDPKEMLLESPYEKIELFWPLELLKNGIEIIDSPGLNEHATRTKVTVDYLSKADAILFVLSATSLCSKEEMSFIENTLTPQGFNELFFIVNRFDLIPDKEKKTIIKYASTKLHNFTTLEPDWLFFVSARDALDAKIANQKKELIASGIPKLENCLSEFLTQNKGKAKLIQPARELKRIVTDELLKNHISQEREIISCSLDELKARHKVLSPQLEILGTKKDDLSKKTTAEIKQSESEFRSAILLGLATLQKNIPNWIRDFSPTLKLGVVPTKEKVNLLITEILEHITQQTEAYQANWCKQTLVPLIENKASNMFVSLREEITNLLNSLNSALMEFSTNKSDFTPQTWQSVIRVDELSNITAAYNDTESISKELARVISYNASASLALQTLESTNPIILSASLVSGVFSLLTGAESDSLKKIKGAISDELINLLTQNAQNTANKITYEILDRFNNVLSQISSTLDLEVSQSQEHIQSLISEMENSDYNMTEKCLLLDDCASQLSSICEELDKFIVGLDGEKVLEEYTEFAKELILSEDTDPKIKQEFESALNEINCEDNTKKTNMCIIGEFSTGKSTFINAFIKTDLMSSQFLQATTVTATCIENSETLECKMLFNNGTEETTNPENVDDLKLKLTELDNIAQELHSVHICMPAKTLGTDIRIIDTPGINVENPWHEEVTVRAINELCDIPTILIDATKVLPETLIRFLHSHLSDRLSDCIFIVTKLDMVKPSERSTIMRFVKAKLKQEFGLASPVLLGYSSIDVLSDITKGSIKNPELVSVSYKNEKKILNFAKTHASKAKEQAKIASINKLLELIVANERAKIKPIELAPHPAPATKSMFSVRHSLSSDAPATSNPSKLVHGFKKAKLNN